MKYAVVKTGGKQYLVQPGSVLSIEKIPGEVGQEIELKEVLMVADDQAAKIGAPFIKGAEVKAVIEDQYRAKKIMVVKYKPKVRYRRRHGHRQHYTKIRVVEIKG